MESSGQADLNTVLGFAFRATFDGDIEGFTLLKVLLATTVCNTYVFYIFNQLEMLLFVTYLGLCLLVSVAGKGSLV